MVRRIWRLMEPFHPTFPRFAVVCVVYKLMQLIYGYNISMVVRLYQNQASPREWNLLFGAFVAYVGVFIALDNWRDWYIVTRYVYPIYQQFKLSALTRFLSMDIPWHHSHNSGTEIHKVAKGVSKLQDITTQAAWEFVPLAIQMLVSLLPLLFLSPLAAGLMVGSFSTYLTLTIVLSQKRSVIRKKRHDLYDRESQMEVETVQAVETVKIFNQQSRFYEKSEEVHEQIVALGRQEARLGLQFDGMRIASLMLTFIGIVYIWKEQLYAGTLDVPNLFYLATLVEKLISSFWRFGRLFDQTDEASEAATRLGNLLDEQPLEDTGTVTTPAEYPLGVELRNVCFAYSREYSEDEGALHDVSFTAEPGQVVALVGPSGAGKSTIHRIVMKLSPIQSGEIIVGGVSLKDWQKEALLTQFSYVSQSDYTNILDASLLENIRLGKPEATLEEVEWACKVANLTEFIASLPQGLNTLVGEHGKRLSGGQKQRVAIARAMLVNGPVIILDEATSAVDVINERKIQEQLRSILTNKTAIIIAHRLSTIWDIADKIVVLENGRKIEEGTHAELVAQGGLYATMVAEQTG